jgi:hypothetical protein
MADSLILKREILRSHGGKYEDEDVAPCSLMMEAASTSEMAVKFYKI